MKLGIKTSLIIGCSFLTIGIAPVGVYAEQAPVPAQVERNFMAVAPLDLVHNPNNFLNKDIKITANFHKFSTLGLDYDKAMRSSKDFISILIKRPDVPDKYTIPLSEMKIIMKRDAAEDLLDMESGDKIEITGKVFSSALNDPWIEVYELNNLTPKKEEDTEKKASKN